MRDTITITAPKKVFLFYLLFIAFCIWNVYLTVEIYARPYAKVYVYNQSEMWGAEVSPNVKVLLVDGVKSLAKERSDGFINLGYYNRFTREISLLANVSRSSLRSSLVHEQAHDEFQYNLTPEQRDEVEKYKKRICESADEFYAYTIGYSLLEGR